MSGENNPMFGVTGSCHPNSRKIVVNGILFDSISDCVRTGIYTKKQIEHRLNKTNSGVEYADEGKINGSFENIFS